VSHINDHCALPKITRHWTRLGSGATWTCSCGAQYRLIFIGSIGGDQPSWSLVRPTDEPLFVDTVTNDIAESLRTDAEYVDAHDAIIRREAIAAALELMGADDLIDRAAKAYREAWHRADAEEGDKPAGYRSEQGVRAVIDAVSAALRAEETGRPHTESDER
jgi:hypothetical protein